MCAGSGGRPRTAEESALRGRIVSAQPQTVPHAAGTCLGRAYMWTLGGKEDGRRADRQVPPCDGGDVLSAYVVLTCVATRRATRVPPLAPRGTGKNGGATFSGRKAAVTGQPQSGHGLQAFPTIPGSLASGAGCAPTTGHEWSGNRAASARLKPWRLVGPSPAPHTGIRRSD